MANEASNGKTVHVLLVEDNAADVEMALHALTKNNVTNRIAVVSDGEEAPDFLFGIGAYVERKTANQPRVVLLDLELPKVDGLEALREIRANPSTRLLPVVILTSSREERDIVESYRLGVNSYIVKPVKFERFIATVKDLCLYWLLLNEPPNCSPS